MTRRRALFGGLAMAVALLGAALAAGIFSSSGGSEPQAAAGEDLRLDQVTPTRAPSGEEESTSSRAKVVKPVGPGGVASASGEVDGEEPPPKRVLEENVELRKQLENLKELEKARKRVSKLLARAGAGFTGPLRLGRSGLGWPVAGHSVVSGFGQRWGRLHAGLDIIAKTGDPIRAAADGLVVIANPTGGYGNYVCVQHTRTLTSCYAHLSRYLTEKGAMVSQGDPIGLVGCTGHCLGEHLHFETWIGGRPVDPMRFF